MIRTYLYIGVAISIIGGAWFFLNSWHFAPIKTFKKNIKKQEEIIKLQNITINNLGVQINKLIESNKVTGFEEYFKGYKDENISAHAGSSNLIF